MTIRGRFRVQPGAMDPDQVPGLRVPVVEPFPGLGDGAVVDALHPWIHDLPLAEDAWRLCNGTLTFNSYQQI